MILMDLAFIGSLVVDACNHVSRKISYQQWSDSEWWRILESVYNLVWHVEELAMFPFYTRSRREQDEVVENVLVYARDVFASQPQFDGWLV
jgi:hypothetical protein